MFVNNGAVNLPHVCRPNSILGRILPSACVLLMLPLILAASEQAAPRTYEDYDFKEAAPSLGR